MVASLKPLPKSFSLSAAYPNPFNPVINISYRVNVSKDISINIYDIKGRLVDSLIDEFHISGEYDLIWDAQSASSGIYFIRYNTHTGSFRQKITLIK